MNDSVKITILAHNKAEKNLDPEHGFSAWIEASGICILFDTGQGTALAGNTLNHVMAITGETKIWTVTGGFHLTDASHSRMEETLNQLRKISPDIIAPCHCTGEKALELIREEFNPGFMPCHAGTVISLPRTGEPGQA